MHAGLAVNRVSTCTHNTLSRCIEVEMITRFNRQIYVIVLALSNKYFVKLIKIGWSDIMVF